MHRLAWRTLNVARLYAAEADGHHVLPAGNLAGAVMRRCCGRRKPQ